MRIKYALHFPLFLFQEFYIKENSIISYNLVTFKINDCPKVRFGSLAILNMRSIRHIELSNIDSLILEESSLEWKGFSSFNENSPSVRVTIQNSHINKIAASTFKGIFKEILFRNVVVGEIAPYAFTLTPDFETKSMEFFNTSFNKIQPQAFKKFRTETLKFEECTFQTLPSRAFNEIYVKQKFIVSNSTFHAVTPYAFFVINPYDFRVVNTRINILEGEGFKVTTRGGCVFRNNIIYQINSGAFKGISVNREEVFTKQQIIFDSNTFVAYTSEFLNINQSSFEPKIINILIKSKCDCKSIENYFTNDQLTNDISCLYEETAVAISEFKKYNCSIISFKTTTAIIVGCVVLLLVILTGFGLVCYFKRLHRSGKYTKNHGETSNNKNLSLIVPDGKTYRETELHVIVERADLLTTDL